MSVTYLSSNGKSRKLHTKHAGKNCCRLLPGTRLLSFAPDYLALPRTTRLCTWQLGLHRTTRIRTRQLGFAPNYLALHQRLGFAPNDWTYTQLLGLRPTTPIFSRLLSIHPIIGLSPTCWDIQWSASVSLVPECREDVDMCKYCEMRCL